MPDITIDPGAVESARVSMLTIRDTLNVLHAQHESVFGEIERNLSDITTSVMEALDPFGIWERFGFDSASYRCQSIRGALEQTRGDTEYAVNHLCDVHTGQVAQAIHNRAGDLLSVINSALDSLWTITSFFNLRNVVHMIKDHNLIQEHFSNSRRALDHARTAAQEFVDFLTRLGNREQAVIDEIVNTLTVTSPSLTGGLQGGPITIQGTSGLLQGTSGYLQGETPPSAPAPVPDKFRLNPPGSPEMYAATPGAAILAWAEYYARQKNYYTQNTSYRRGAWDDGKGYGFDCSGFVYRVLNDSGNGDLLKGDTPSHPYDSSILGNEYNSGTPIAITGTDAPTPTNVVPGSLVFFDDPPGHLEHVGIVVQVGKTIGDTMVMSATTDGKQIETYAIKYSGQTPVRFVTFDRMAG